MKKVAILIDSGSNYFAENIESNDIFCTSLQVVDGDKGYREGQEISSIETYHMIKEGKLLKTSSPLVSDVEDLVDSIIEKGYDAIFAVNITSGLSSTISMVSMVCNQKEISYDYFDCFTTARVQLECALRARDLFNQGEDIIEVKKQLQEMIDHSNTYVLPIDLKHLQRGGRLSPTAATVAGLLKIVPILYLNESTGGLIETMKKVRTMKKAIDQSIEDMIEHGVNENYKVCVAHVLDESLGQYVLDLIKERIPGVDIYLTDLVPVVGVHTGLGCIAMQYVKVKA